MAKCRAGLHARTAWGAVSVIAFANGLGRYGSARAVRWLKTAKKRLEVG